MDVHIIELATQPNRLKQVHVVCTCGYAVLYLPLDNAYSSTQSHLDEIHDGEGSVTFHNRPLEVKTMGNIKVGLLPAFFMDYRNPDCVKNWPDCQNGSYDPSCCRFPKSCSC